MTKLLVTRDFSRVTSPCNCFRGSPQMTEILCFSKAKKTRMQTHMTFGHSASEQMTSGINYHIQVQYLISLKWPWLTLYGSTQLQSLNNSFSFFITKMYNTIIQQKCDNILRGTARAICNTHKNTLSLQLRGRNAHQFPTVGLYRQKVYHGSDQSG